MKKFYRIFLFTLVAMIAGSSAKAEESQAFSYGYCTDQITGVGSDSGVSNYWIAAAFRMTEADVERFDGCEVTGVSVGFGTGRNKNITIFFTEDLAGTPFATQEGRTRPSSWNDIDLTEPFTITKGKPFYIGYKYNVINSNAMPVGVDGNTAAYTSGADWLSLADEESQLAGNWKQYGETFGNISLRVYLKGNNLPTHNCLPNTLVMPDLAHPGKEFEFTLEFSNISTATVNSIEVEYQLGADAAKTGTYTLSPAVAANEKGSVTIKAQTDQDSFTLPVRAKITKVNGEANAMADKEISTTMVCTDGLFERKVVAEKQTGTGCQYCPRAIVAFDHVIHKYGKKFIPIEVHNYPGDPMWCTSYETAQEKILIGGFPTMVVNRNRDIGVPTEKSSLETLFLKEYTEACPIGVFVSFENVKSNSVTVTATVKSAFDVDNADYSVTFVVTEDNLGPYYQTNYFDSNPGLPEWGGRGTRVLTYYNDVARYIHPDWNGIDNSVPTRLEAGVEYPYTVTNMSLGSTSNRNNANLIALLIDNATGYIVNADRVSIDPNHPTGAEAIEAEENEAAAEYYTLSGIRLQQKPASGIVIEKKGNETRKIKL